jgi:hypothetical protein
VAGKQLIMIGGPRHGTMADDAGMILPVMDQIPQGPAVSSNYVKRNLKIARPDGEEFVRYLYVHESVTQEEFVPMFANYLIGSWVVAGEEKLENTQNVVPAGEPAGVQRMEDGTSRTVSGLFIA